MANMFPDQNLCPFFNARCRDNCGLYVSPKPGNPGIPGGCAINVIATQLQNVSVQSKPTR